MELLLGLGEQFHKPVITASGLVNNDFVERVATGVHGLWRTPLSTLMFWNTLRDCLKIARVVLEKSGEITPRSRQVLRPRIVLLDDEPMVLDVIEAIIQNYCYKDASVLTFTDGDDAWRELLREDPDLFATDWQHPRIHGGEMLHLLAKKKVKYPILVLSGSANVGHVLMSAGPDLNVTVFRKPFTPKTLKDELVKHLGPADQPDPPVPKHTP